MYIMYFFMYTMYDHVCHSDQSGGIYDSKSLVAMDLWSKNHSLSSGYRPWTWMVLDHKSLATGLLLLLKGGSPIERGQPHH